MALIPHKEDPNYDSEMARYKKDNTEWAGDDMNKGMPPKQPDQTQHQPKK